MVPKVRDQQVAGGVVDPRYGGEIHDAPVDKAPRHQQSPTRLGQDHVVRHERETRRSNLECFQNQSVVKARHVGRIGSHLDLQAVGNPVAIAIGEQRVRHEAIFPRYQLFAVAYSVSVGVRVRNIRSEVELLEVG